MEESLALSIGLPVALVVIMLGLGLSLRLEDFTRCFSRPWPLVVGLVCQMVLLPAICFAMVFFVEAPPAIAVGMMLLAASPGGPSAAIFTHLARGDSALSLVHVAATSVIALLTLPVVANLSLAVFYGEATEVRLQAHQVLQIFVIAIIPALIGALISRRYPAVAERMDRPVKAMATVFLTAIVLTALFGQWELLIIWGPTVGVLAIVFNIVSLLVGYAVPRGLGIEREQAIGLAMSTGVHNAALVIAITMSGQLLGNSEMAIPSAAYGLFAYPICGVSVWIFNRRSISP